MSVKITCDEEERTLFEKALMWPKRKKRRKVIEVGMPSPDHRGTMPTLRAGKLIY